MLVSGLHQDVTPSVAGARRRALVAFGALAAGLSFSQAWPTDISSWLWLGAAVATCLISLLLRRPFALPCLTIAAILTLIAGAIIVLLRRRGSSEVAAPSSLFAPSRMTPLGVVTSLRRYRTTHAPRLNEARRTALDQEIGDLELKYFGPQATPHHEGELRTVVERWAGSEVR